MREKKKRILFLWGAGIVLPLLLIELLYVLQRFLISYPAIGEAYARGPFKFLSYLPSRLSSLVPISITEVLCLTAALASPFLIAWFILRIVRSIRQKKGRKFFFGKARILTWGLFAMYAFFMLFHGINYTRRPLEESLGFGQRTYTVEELGEVYIWVILQINEARTKSFEDENGVIAYPGGMNVFWDEAQRHYRDAASIFPSLQGNVGRPKPVAASRYWSYTNIVGLYDPFLCECNVNKATTFTEIASSAFHEMSHLNGYAVENNANLASMLIRMNCDKPEIRYSGFSDALPLIEEDFVKAFNGNSDVIRQVLEQVPLCDGFYRDWAARVEFWDSINPPPIVETVSNNVNDSFLKVNQQKEGVQSYHVQPSVVADYYYTYVKPQE